ncbi:MAG: Ig-like domain-containing protein, partial [Roseococcus sp.]
PPATGDFDGLLPYVEITTAKLLTKVTTQTLSGRADPGATVTFFENGALLNTFTADPDGAWSMQRVYAADGVYTYTAQVTDPDGTTTTLPTVITIDTTPPPGDMALRRYLGLSDLDVGQSTTPTGIKLFTTTLTGTGEAGATLRLYEQGATPAANTLLATQVLSGSTWSQVVKLSVDLGKAGDPAPEPTLIFGTLTDAAGNMTEFSVGGAGGNSLTVDLLPPVLTVIYPVFPPNVHALIPVHGNLPTNQLAQTLTGTVDPFSTVVLTRLIGTAQSYESFPLASTVADSDGKWSASFTLDPAWGGKVTVKATAIDLAGNTAIYPKLPSELFNNSGINYYYDTVPSRIISTELVNNNEQNLAPASNVTKPIYAKGTDTLQIALKTEGNGQFYVYDQNNTLLGKTIFAPQVGANPTDNTTLFNGGISLDVPDAEGTYTLRIEGQDFAGNVSNTLNMRSIIVDNTPPSYFTLQAPSYFGGYSFNGGPLLTQHVTNQLTHHFSGTGEAGNFVYARITTASNQAIVEQFVATTDADGNWSADLTLPPADGDRNIVFSLRDAAGNAILADGETDPIAATVNIWTDVTKPVISLQNGRQLISQEVFSNTGTGSATLKGIGLGLAENNSLITLKVEWNPDYFPQQSLTAADHGLIALNYGGRVTAQVTKTYTLEIPYREYPGRYTFEDNGFVFRDGGGQVSPAGPLFPSFSDTFGEGYATLTFTATDRAGNVSTPYVATMIIDNTAPIAPNIGIFHPLASGSATNKTTITLGYPTQDFRLPWSFNNPAPWTVFDSVRQTYAEAGSTVFIYDKRPGDTYETAGVIKVVDIPQDYNGYSLDAGGQRGVGANRTAFSTEVGITDGGGVNPQQGVHEIFMRSLDAAGNWSARSASYFITSDTIAPSLVSPLTVDGFGPSYYRGGVAYYGSANTSVVLSGKFSEAIAGGSFTGAKLAPTLNNPNNTQATFGTLQANAAGEFGLTIDNTTPFFVGATVTTRDVAGNQVITRVNIVRDTEAPDVAITTSDFAVNTRRVTITGTGEAGRASDNTDGGSLIEIYVGDTLLTTTRAQYTSGPIVATTSMAAQGLVKGVWTATVDLPTDGLNTIRAVATDVARNVGVSNTITVDVDTVPPYARFANELAWVPTGTPIITGFGEVGAKIRLYDGIVVTGPEHSRDFSGATLVAETTVVRDPLTGEGIWSVAVPLSTEGEHVLGGITTDPAGNSQEMVEAIYTVDRIAPPIAVTFFTALNNAQSFQIIEGTSDPDINILVYDGTTDRQLQDE